MNGLIKKEKLPCSFSYTECSLLNIDLYTNSICISITTEDFFETIGGGKIAPYISCDFDRLDETGTSALPAKRKSLLYTNRIDDLFKDYVSQKLMFSDKYAGMEKV
ncbi:MAG: hypothetical protein JWN76_2803 [Chitinophagaceae bacterium]|nr:hypothetical protein [Chitinophagaceae bacterium]